MVPALFVTDGFMIEYVDLTTGFLAPPTFYAPWPCNPTMAPSNGLAYAGSVMGREIIYQRSVQDVQKELAQKSQQGRGFRK